MTEKRLYEVRMTLVVYVMAEDETDAEDIAEGRLGLSLIDEGVIDDLDIEPAESIEARWQESFPYWAYGTTPEEPERTCQAILDAQRRDDAEKARQISLEME